MNADQLEKTLNNTRAWILAVDQKTNILLVLVLGLITLIAKPSFDLFYAHILVMNAWSVVLLSIAIGSFALCIMKLVMTVKPRTKSKGSQSLIYFGDIAGYSLKEYRRKVKSATGKDVIDDLVEQIYITSGIASSKHGNYRDAISALVVGILFWIGYIITLPAVFK